MYKFKLKVAKENIDEYVKKNFTEEEKEALKNIKFVPFNVHCNDDMDIEIMAVGVVDFGTETDDKA